MRNLTIKRIKSFAGSLGKANVYIEDPVARELTIGKVPCRKIGQLKNGEEKTFQIEETAAKVFVIMDRLSKDFCNDFYQLPKGQEDISLSGRNVFNLAVGNPFRFDNNNDAQALANRKRNTKRGPFVMIGAILIGLVIGSYIGYFAVAGFLANKAPKEKTFTYQEMNITLTDQFVEQDNGENSRVLSAGETVVVILKEPFITMEGFGDLTLEEYGELVLNVNGYDTDMLQKADGLVTFTYEYEHPEEKVVIWYYSVVYKADNAFWLIQFAAPKSKATDYRDQFITWAKTVQFSGEEGI